MTEETPEIGDIVEWGESEFYPSGALKFAASRGAVCGVYQNGNIKVKPEYSDKIVRLHPGEFTVLSKAG